MLTPPPPPPHPCGQGHWGLGQITAISSWRGENVPPCHHGATFLPNIFPALLLYLTSGADVPPSGDPHWRFKTHGCDWRRHLFIFLYPLDRSKHPGGKGKRSRVFLFLLISSTVAKKDGYLSRRRLSWGPESWFRRSAPVAAAAAAATAVLALSAP